MIHFIHDVPEEIIAVSVDDQLTAEDYEKYNRMVRLKEPADELKLYLEIDAWEGMTFKALLKDIETGFKNYDKISKIAVATPEEWIQKATKVSDAILPGIEMKVFNLSEKDRAMAWLR